MAGCRSYSLQAGAFPMNYKRSKQILVEIKKAQKILINCHRHPDADSVGSALALYQVIQGLGKGVEVVSPNSLLERLNFLPFSEKIASVDYKDFDFSKFDLFIVPDSSNWRMVVGSALGKVVPLPKIPIIVIDHHKTNEKYGRINLVDSKVTSTAEILYLLFQDWGVEINQDIATNLLAGIIGDTGVFQFPGVTSRTFDIARRLMDKGADKEEIVQNLYRSTEFNFLKFWGEVLKSMQFDQDHGFVWSAIPYETYKKFSKPESGREAAASNFTQIVKDSDFGFVMVEEEKEVLSVSLRSRTGFDVSKIASFLGGGGHKAAAGARVEGLEFEEAVEKVLQAARKFAKKNEKKGQKMVS